jgi:hypothetical protein
MDPAFSFAAGAPPVRPPIGVEQALRDATQQHVREAATPFDSQHNQVDPTRLHQIM